MLHIQSVWKRVRTPITQIFIFKLNASFHLTVTSISYILEFISSILCIIISYSYRDQSPYIVE